jgi:hypothetical protein
MAITDIFPLSGREGLLTDNKADKDIIVLITSPPQYQKTACKSQFLKQCVILNLASRNCNFIFSSRSHINNKNKQPESKKTVE